MYNTQMQGFFKLEAVKVDKYGQDVSRRVLADWFPNLLLDYALDIEMKGETHIYYAGVGTGSTTPTASDTTLEAPLGPIVKNNGTNWSYPPGNGFGPDSSPYYMKGNRSFAWALGAVVGNISEIGVYKWSSSGLGSRSLIKDSNGNPTTVTLTSLEYLVASYECRYYQSEATIVGSFLINGETFNWTSRNCDIRNTEWSANWDIYNHKLWLFGSPNVAHFRAGYVYNGTIGATAKDLPSGPSTGLSGSIAAYINGTYTRGVNLSLSLGSGNLSGGFNVIRFSAQTGHYQIGLDTNVLKDNTNTFTMATEFSLQRYVAP